MDDLGSALDSEQPVYMLGGGNPGFIPSVFKRFQTEMAELVADDLRFQKMVGQYDAPQGNRAFIDALVDLLNQRYGWPISTDNIVITNGSQSSFGFLFNLLAGEFDDGSFKKILLPLTPEYIGYSDVGYTQRQIFTANKPIIEKRDDGFFKYRVDFDQLDLSQDINAVCVSRPTNPTGNVITDNELAKLSRLTREAGIPLIIDGAYGVPFPGIIFDQATPIWDDHIILCLSLSKIGLPGVRTGIVIAAKKMVDKLRGAQMEFKH